MIRRSSTRRVGDETLVANRLGPGRDLVFGEWPQPAQQVFNGVDIFRLPGVGEALEFGFESGEHIGIEQLT